MKTPMQEHIKWLKEEVLYVKKVGGGRMVGRTYIQCLEICINHAELHLEKEKEVINKAYEMGSRDYLANLKDDYYNETFNNKE